MAKRGLRIIASIGVLCATAAGAVFVPAASAVLPGDGGGGYVSCSASDTTWRGLTTPRISCSGYRVGFYAYNASYQSPCYQYGYNAKVFFVVNGSWDPYNPVWTGGPFSTAPGTTQEQASRATTEASCRR